jgi:GTPase SAR1 family protein
MPIDGGAIGLKVAIDLVKRPAMSGLARVHTWLTGHEVLVLGPARAGKTSFVDYLRYGVLEPAQQTEKTLNIEKTTTFTVKIGRDASLELKVKRAVDVAGQVGPIEHARIAERRRPHAVVVLLDLSAPVTGKSDRASGPWLIEFCKHLDERIRTNAKMRKRLKTIIFVANKYDSQSTEAAGKRIEAFRRIVRKHLGMSFSTRVDSIPIMPCTLVLTENTTSLADSVIIRLAKALSE